MTPFRSLLFASAVFLASTALAKAGQRVIVSVKPIHSLVAGMMAGVGEPGIIVDGAGSPHAYSLKPSQASRLEKAGLIVWVGHELEAFLEKPIETLGGKARVVQLVDANGLTKLPLREGGAFEEHDHDLQDEHDDMGAEMAGAADGHGPDDNEDDNHGGIDVHLWLDPQNAKAMVRDIERALIETDSANAARYEANAQALIARLDDLSAEIENILAPVKDKPFIVFHDAYQYFENRFGIRAAGSITVSPETIPGAERIADIQARANELGATCVFAEPQFEPKLVSVVIEGTKARSAVLDPLGASIENGPELYFTLMRNMATSMRDCLSAGN